MHKADYPKLHPMFLQRWSPRAFAEDAVSEFVSEGRMT